MDDRAQPDMCTVAGSWKLTWGLLQLSGGSERSKRGDSGTRSEGSRWLAGAATQQ
jgi:hypothetical protein